jgi:hypothetical protein
MIARGRLITDPRKRAVMDCLTLSIESASVSAYRTNVTETGMVCSLQSWIASSMPLDDSRKWIVEGTYSFQECAKGEEGADIIIEQL